MFKNNEKGVLNRNTLFWKSGDCMKITVLDSGTLGDDIILDMIKEVGETEVFEKTSQDEVAKRIVDSDVIILNKIKVNESNLSGCKNLKLICVTATGYDNIDIEYCKKHGIAVCNVAGYSSDSVSQVTVATVLSLVCHLTEYNRFSKSGEYMSCGKFNSVSPVYYELAGKTWGIVGYGGIGKRVATVAEALGCRVIYTRNTPDENSVSIDTLMSESDIITLHIPLNDKTRNLINKDKLKLCKKKPVIVNASRGGVWDEEAVTEAVLDGTLSALGTDVYTVEPMQETSPFTRLFDCDNVILTPHMAWGAYESRIRCMREVAENIKSFIEGGRKGRIV